MRACPRGLLGPGRDAERGRRGWTGHPDDRVGPRAAGRLAQVGRRGRGRSCRPSATADDRGVDRLFRHLVPDVTGRRSGHEIIDRLRRKWDLDHSLVASAGARARPVPRPGRAARAGPVDVLERLDRDFAALAPDRSPTCMPAGRCSASTASIRPGRARPRLRPRDRLLHPDDLRAAVPTPAAPSRCAAAAVTTAWRACWASPRRPRRRLRVRAGTVAKRPGCPRGGDISPPVLANGYLITSGIAGEVTPATIDLATFLRERIQIPIFLADLEFQAAVDHARALGLGHVVTVGQTIELWNLEHGDVRSIREGELIEQMRTRLAVFRGDRLVSPRHRPHPPGDPLQGPPL